MDRLRANFPLLFVGGFTLLSFYGTWVGLDGIISLGDNEQGAGQTIVFVFVMLLTLAMVYMLELFLKFFGSYKCLLPLLAYIPLLIFSISFGFAFYWQRLNANDEAINTSTSGVLTIETEVRGAKERLDALRADMDSLSAQFARLAEVERVRGGTCGDNSPPGDGPRRRHRERRAGEIAQRVATLSTRFDRLAQPIQELEDRRRAIEEFGRKRSSERTSAERGALIEEAESASVAAAAQIEQLAADPIIVETAATFDQWADEYSNRSFRRTDDPNGSRYVCYSPETAAILRGAATSLRSLPSIQRPEFDAFVGAEATREALLRVAYSLWPFGPESFASTADIIAAPLEPVALPNLSSALPDEDEAKIRRILERNAELRDENARLRDKNAKGQADEAVTLSQPIGQGLKEADYFPLFVAAFVDFLLFVFAAISHVARRRLGPAERLYEDSQNDSRVTLEVLLKSERLQGHSQWQRLTDYLFRYQGEYYLLLPPRLSAGHSYDLAQDLFIALIAQRFLVESSIPPKKMEEKFKAGHRPNGIVAETLEEIEHIDVYRIVRSKFDRLVFQMMDDRAEHDHAPDPAPKAEKSGKADPEFS